MGKIVKFVKRPKKVPEPISIGPESRLTPEQMAEIAADFKAMFTPSELEEFKRELEGDDEG